MVESETQETFIVESPLTSGLDGAALPVPEGGRGHCQGPRVAGSLSDWDHGVSAGNLPLHRVVLLILTLVPSQLNGGKN